MDTAVALVQAYLHLNGYLTLCEDPVLEDVRRGGIRSYLSRNWAAVRHVLWKNPTLALFALLEKVRRAEARGGGIPRAVGGLGIVR